MYEHIHMHSIQYAFYAQHTTYIFMEPIDIDK